jgi:hypothetical protein
MTRLGAHDAYWRAQVTLLLDFFGDNAKGGFRE